jgi:hypothetical protein
MASAGSQRQGWGIKQSTEAMSTGMDDNEAWQWQWGHSGETKEGAGNVTIN